MKGGGKPAAGGQPQNGTLNPGSTNAKVTILQFRNRKVDRLRGAASKKPGNTSSNPNAGGGGEDRLENAALVE